MKNQIKFGVILSYLSIVINIIIQLCYMPIMIRILGQSEYGLYTLVSGVVSYLSLFSLGFSGAYLRFFSRYHIKRDEKGIAELNGMFIVIFIILSIVAMICGFILCAFPRQVFGAKLNEQELQTAQILMEILVVNIALSLVSSIFESITSAYEQFIFQRVLNLVATVINPLVCLPLLIVGKGSIALVTITTIITLLKLVITIWFCISKIQIKISFFHFHLDELVEVGKFSFFILLNMIIDQVNWNVDKVILSHVRGTQEVAIYGVAAQINSLVMMFSTTISSVFSPRVNQIAAKGGDQRNRKFTELMIRIGRVQWFVLALVITGFIVFGKYFITNIFAGKEYEHSYAVTLFLIIPAIVPLIQNIGIEIQRSLNKHQFRSIIYLGMAVINIFVSIPLAQKFGAVGTAAGTAIGMVIANIIIMNIYYSRGLKLNMKLFWKQILSCSKGLIAPAIVGIIISIKVKFTLQSYLIWILIYILIYCLNIYYLGCNKEERDLLKGLLNRRH